MSDLVFGTGFLHLGGVLAWIISRGKDIFIFIRSLAHHFFELAPPGVVPPRRLYLRGSELTVSN